MILSRDPEAAAVLAKAMALICVRNTKLEELHAGRTPITRTGDYTDIRVIDADGREFTWAEVSRLNDDEMRNLMREVVNKLFTFQMRIYDPDYQAMVDRWLPGTQNWDEPVLETGGKKRFEEGGQGGVSPLSQAP